MLQNNECIDDVSGGRSAEAAWSEDLSAHCFEMFRSLARSDQRRASEIYVTGLLQCPGKKSMRRIASETSGGYSDQSLQQFVNQSGWDPAPVRRRLSARLSARCPPTAWVVDELAFRKHGRSSAGVERQYVGSRGRLSNCQLGVFVALVGADAAIPVTWRLSIPRSWDSDQVRRRKARIPPDERHRSHWQYQVEALDDLAGDWGVPLAPVVMDVRPERSFDELVHELDNRGLDFLMQVNHTAPLRLHGARHRPVDGTPREFAAALAVLPRRTLAWTEPGTGLQVRAQFSMASVRAAAAEDGAESTSRIPQILLIEWGLGRREPRGFWLTNMVDRSIEDLVALSRLPRRVTAAVTTMIENFGLCDYEGRSFLGWHHHVTLVSIAYAFHVGRPAVGRSTEPHLHPEGIDHDVDRHSSLGQPDRPGHAERAGTVPGRAGPPARLR